MIKPSKKYLNLTIDGHSIIDLMVYIAVAILLLSVALLVISPVEIQRRARDEKRLGDLARLDTAINEYKIDNDSLPDSSDILRESNTLPDGNFGPLNDLTSGWIDANFNQYLVILPVDPINDSVLHYYYQHNGSNYELNALFEYYTDKAENDGGDDSTRYETGDRLDIISPTP